MTQEELVNVFKNLGIDAKIVNLNDKAVSKEPANPKKGCSGTCCEKPKDCANMSDAELEDLLKFLAEEKQARKAKKSSEHHVLCWNGPNSPIIRIFNNGKYYILKNNNVLEEVNPPKFRPAHVEVLHSINDCLAYIARISK